MKLTYCSPSINNEDKIKFNNYELKTDANGRAMWNTTFHFETKVSIEVEATISRSIVNIVKTLKRPPEYLNVMFDFMLTSPMYC